MAYYLVRANLREGMKEELCEKLENNEFRSLRPFGEALTYSLTHARVDPDNGEVIWEEEDYCSPPLAEEREAVLDDYFENITVERVMQGAGWDRIRDLPLLWEEG